MAQKIAFEELNSESVQELADESLLNEHRHIHGLAELGQVACRELRRVHRVVVAEIVRRGMEHDSPLECSEKAVELERPHGFLVWRGKQSAIASDRELPAGEPLLLVSDGEAFGMVTLGEAARMLASEFDRIEWAERHCVRPEERRMWWPEAETLYVHDLREWRGFERPLLCEFADGEARVKDYEPPTEKESQVLSMSERLPKQIILTPRAVSLTGSMLYGQHEPADTDIVVVGAEWRADEGQFVVPLTPTFREKLARAFRAVYQTEHDVQFIAEGQGATFDHLPLYSLALVRLPRLEVEHVSEGEPDFAALCYDKPGEKALTQAALDRKLRGASDEVKRQAKQTYDEDRVVPGRMVLSLKPLRPAPQGERQVVSHFYDYIEKHLEFPLYVSAKRDGATHYAHSDGKRVWLYSDDGEDNTDKLPTLVEAFKKTYKGKSFVFGVEVEKWVDGEHYPREAAIGDVKRGEDGDLAANIFRVVYWDGKDLHKAPFGEVWDDVMKDMPADSRTDGALDPRENGPVNVVPHHKVGSLGALKEQLGKTAYKPGVEGVVVKRVDADFPLDGEADTDNPQEVKWHKSVAGVLTASGKTETKTKGVYVYDLAIGDMEIGKTFGTKQDIAKGSAVEVEAEQVNLERDEDGEVARVSFWAPDLIGKSDKKPETLETIIERAKRHGVLREKVVKPGGEIEYLPNDSGQPATADKQASFKPPKAVQEAATLGLELRRQFGRGGTQVGVARARDLSNGRAVSLDTVQRMASYFARHAVDAEAEGWEDKDNPSAGYIAWLLWGGDPGREWAERILRRAEKQEDILLRYPDEGKKQRFVFQNHFRGRSVHGDFRAQNDDFLVGWTIANQQPGEIKEPVETLTAARKAAGQPENWKMDLKTGLIKPREIRGGTTRRGDLRAFPKGTEIPEAWLNVEGATDEPDPGESVPVGATANYPGVFDIVQKGTVEYGALKPDFKEYFIKGDTWPAQRWTFRLIGRSGKWLDRWCFSDTKELLSDDTVIEIFNLHHHHFDGDPWDAQALPGEPRYKAETTLPPGEEEEDPRQPFYWVLMQPVDQTPHVLSKRAVDSGWMPPKGVSALPKAIRDRIPKEMRYWETSGEKALERRRQIVEELDVRELVGPELKEIFCVSPEESSWFCDACGEKLTVISASSLPEYDKEFFCPECAKQVGPWRDYMLQRRTWKGQTVIRFGPSTEIYDLWMKRDGKPWHLVMQRDPRKGDPVVAYEDGETKPTFKDADGKQRSVFDVKDEVSIAPGEALNPTKDTPAMVETVDRGQVRTLSEAPEFVKKEFKGGDLKGAFAFEREEAGGDLGQFGPSAGPETKGVAMVYLYDCEVCGKEMESNEPLEGKPVCGECQDTKAGRRIRGEKLSLLKDLREGFNDLMGKLGELIQWAGYEEEPFTIADLFKEETGVMVKEVNGVPWHFCWSANAFKDRQGEIFSTAALERFVHEVSDRKQKGYFNFWHIPGTDFAKKEFVELVGRFLIEAGPYLSDEKGQKALKFFRRYPKGHPKYAPEGWGASVEFRYLPEERRTGVYNWVWFPRTSTLPRSVAANIWNRSSQEVVMATTLTGERKESAIELFGSEAFVDKLIKYGEKETERLEQEGVDHKGETETDEKQASRYVSALREIARMVEDDGIKKQIQGVLDGLTARNMEERAGTLRMAAGRLKDGEAKTRLERIAKAMAAGEEYPGPGEDYPTPGRREASEMPEDDVKQEEMPKDEEQEAASTETEETKEFPFTLEEIAEAVKGAIEVDLKPVAEMLTGLEAVQTKQHEELTARIEKLEKREARKSQTDLPRFQIAVMERASQAEETVVPDGDDLKEQKPETDKLAIDGSMAQHYFPKKK